MPPPTPSDQVKFLTDLQRLLAEGLFTATYKYALLAALADLSVEHGDDSGDCLVLSSFSIAEKLTEYYWRHATPYAAGNQAHVLRQSSGSQARVLLLVAQARERYGNSLAGMMRQTDAWRRLVRSIVPTVRQQPLWRLQIVGPETLDFLYGPSQTVSIELKPGVAFCFRQFFALIQDLVKAAWLRDVRRLNGELMGESTDLRDFLFGAERTALSAVKPVLMELQAGKCFYCAASLKEPAAEVDHFIPWTRYSADLLHNLVLSDRLCNSKKRDRIAHVDHLTKWVVRNREQGDQLTEALATRVVSDLRSADSVALWSYSQTEKAKGLTWIHGDTLAPLSPNWRNIMCQPLSLLPTL